MSLHYVSQIKENIHRLCQTNIPGEDQVFTFIINDLLYMKDFPDLNVFVC